jgi:hypothetical protein
MFAQSKRGKSKGGKRIIVLLHTELEFPGIGVSITPVAWRIR